MGWVIQIIVVTTLRIYVRTSILWTLYVLLNLTRVSCWVWYLWSRSSYRVSMTKWVNWWRRCLKSNWFLLVPSNGRWSRWIKDMKRRIVCYCLLRNKRNRCHRYFPKLKRIRKKFRELMNWFEIRNGIRLRNLLSRQKINFRMWLRINNNSKINGRNKMRDRKITKTMGLYWVHGRNRKDGRRSK